MLIFRNEKPKDTGLAIGFLKIILLYDSQALTLDDDFFFRMSQD